MQCPGQRQFRNFGNFRNVASVRHFRRARNDALEATVYSQFGPDRDPYEATVILQDGARRRSIEATVIPGFPPDPDPFLIEATVILRLLPEYLSVPLYPPSQRRFTERKEWKKTLGRGLHKRLQDTTVQQ